MIYLDYAAATPVDDAVLAAMQPFWQDQFYNPSASYTSARSVAARLEEARRAVAATLGARPAEIIFTAGGTEANNLAIHGIMARYPSAHLAVSAVEHKAVLEVAQQHSHSIIPVNERGHTSPEAVVAAITDNTVLVSVMYANNEVGSIQPLNHITQAVADIRAQRAKAGNALPLFVHTDASQAGNYLDIHVSRLGVDLMTLNGGKIYGPKQTGALFVKAGIELEPLVWGGGQERGLRSGTENVAGVVGFATALDHAQTHRKTEVERLQKLQKMFEEKLQTAAPNTTIHSRGNRLPNIVHVSFPGIDNERLMMQLDEQGIICAVGSACQASSEEPSHVLTAMGITPEEAQSSLRFSFGRGTTEPELEKTLEALAQLLKN